MKKRRLDSDDSNDSASGSDFRPSASLSPSNNKDVKPDIKPKVTKAAKSSPSKGAGGGKLPPGSKAALATLIVQRGLASLPSHPECAEITGMTPAQVKNQLDPRKGVRKELLKLAENLG